MCTFITFFWRYCFIVYGLCLGWSFFISFVMALAVLEIFLVSWCKKNYFWKTQSELSVQKKNTCVHEVALIKASCLSEVHSLKVFKAANSCNHFSLTCTLLEVLLLFLLFVCFYIFFTLAWHIWEVLCIQKRNIFGNDNVKQLLILFVTHILRLFILYVYIITCTAFMWAPVDTQLLFWDIIIWTNV